MLTFSVSSCKAGKEDAEDLNDNAPDVKVFSFSQIERATNRFSVENKIGEGGFGIVYKVKFNKPSCGLTSCVGSEIFMLIRHETSTVKQLIYHKISYQLHLNYKNLKQGKQCFFKKKKKTRNKRQKNTTEKISMSHGSHSYIIQGRCLQRWKKKGA